MAAWYLERNLGSLSTVFCFVFSWSWFRLWSQAFSICELVGSFSLKRWLCETAVTFRMAVNSRSCWKSRFIPTWLAWCCLGLTGMQLERLLLVLGHNPSGSLASVVVLMKVTYPFRLVFRVWKKSFLLLPPFLLLLEKKPKTQKGLAACTRLLSEWYFLLCMWSVYCLWYVLRGAVVNACGVCWECIWRSFQVSVALHLVLGRDLLTEQATCHFGWAGWPVNSWSLPFFSHQCWVTGMYYAQLFFFPLVFWGRASL